MVDAAGGYGVGGATGGLGVWWMLQVVKEWGALLQRLREEGDACV